MRKPRKVARAYIAAAPERMVWGSDWPHPTETEKPDDAVLFDLLSDVGAGRSHAPAHPGREPGEALRISEIDDLRSFPPRRRRRADRARLRACRSGWITTAPAWPIVSE